MLFTRLEPRLKPKKKSVTHGYTHTHTHTRIIHSVTNLCIDIMVKHTDDEDNCC